MRTELSDFILLFEKLNYLEVDHIIKKLWMAFEVAWEQEHLDKEHATYHEDTAEYLNASEKILKDTFLKVMKSLALNVYEAKAAALRKENITSM